MSTVIVLAILVAGLFALAYFTRRRFGVLGLALCAGSLLSAMWTQDVTPFVRDAGFETVAPPLSAVVAAGLILLPAILLLFSGPKYSHSIHRLVGSLAFALLATSFLLVPLGNSLNLDPIARNIMVLLTENSSLVVTAAIGYALFDILSIKAPKKEK